MEDTPDHSLPPLRNIPREEILPKVPKLNGPIDDKDLYPRPHRDDVDGDLYKAATRGNPQGVRDIYNSRFPDVQEIFKAPVPHPAAALNEAQQPGQVQGPTIGGLDQLVQARPGLAQELASSKLDNKLGSHQDDVLVAQSQSQEAMIGPVGQHHRQVPDANQRFEVGIPFLNYVAGLHMRRLIRVTCSRSLVG